MNSNNIATANAVSVQAAAPPTPKQCCGCCCDHRRAVIIVDMIIVVLEALILILIPIGAFDQALMVQDEELYKTEMIFSGVAIATGLFSIYGAYIFNIWPVLLNVTQLIVLYVAGIIYVVQWCKDYEEENSYTSEYYTYTATCSISGGTIFVQGIIMLLWLYPHIGFIVQVLKGTLAKDTYAPRSCCCVDNSAVARIDQQDETPVVVTNASRMEEGIKQKEYEL